MLTYSSIEYGSLWKKQLCVCDYHIYKDIWDAVIGEGLRGEREPNTNKSDWYAVTIKR